MTGSWYFVPIMPSVSRAQHNFMEAVAHDPAFARKAGVSQKVGNDFAAADKQTGAFRGTRLKQQPEHVFAHRRPRTS